MNNLNPFGTGRIREIIAYLQLSNGVGNITSLPPSTKLAALCEVLQFSPGEFDYLIAHNSPVLRTITGHAFEVVFDYIIVQNGYKVVEVGGDDGVDRIVNGVSLQLKTPNRAGTRGVIAEYKTHKTHGAKSEAESSEYYHSVHDFADYFVGLISYSPFRVVFIPKNQLPTHPIYTDRIISPFRTNWADHSGVNAFSVVGMNNVTLDASLFACTNPSLELLPLSAQKIGLKSEIIIDTILRESNFRIWDMNMRGFAREFAFRRMLRHENITPFLATDGRQHRADKADLALLSKNSDYKFLQMKGLSVSNCCFDGGQSMLAIETQLTRGRYNDHATQSRLYLAEDFDYLVVGVDPSLVQRLQLEIGNKSPLKWEFYAIPSDRLLRYSRYNHRFNYMQKFLYSDVQEFLITKNWLSNWQ